MDRTLTNAFWASGAHVPSLRLLWETGPQAGFFTKKRKADDSQIFNRPHAYPFSHAPTSFDDPTSVTAFDMLDSLKPLYATCVKALGVRTFEEDREKKSKLAIRKWRLTLSHDYNATAFGREIQDELSKWVRGDFIDEMIVDVFGVKSPKTSLKRANSIIKYLAWHSIQSIMSTLVFL